MKNKTIKTTTLAHIGEDWYPNGLPDDTDNSVVEKYTYYDMDGNSYNICYSTKQIMDEYNKWGFFGPYTPLMIMDFSDFSSK